MTISLDRVRYRLRVYYCFRSSSWNLDLQTDSGADILLGVALVPEWPLISRFKIAGLPSGEFRLVDTSGKGTPPTRDDFGVGRRCRLYYDEAAA